MLLSLNVYKCPVPPATKIPWESTPVLLPQNPFLDHHPSRPFCTFNYKTNTFDIHFMTKSIKIIFLSYTLINT